MKHVASVLIVCIVSGVFWSSDVNAGQQADEIQVADSAPSESAGAAVAEEDSTDPKETSIVAGGGQPAGQWAREMGVLVMSQVKLAVSFTHPRKLGKRNRRVIGQNVIINRYHMSYAEVGDLTKK